MQLSRRQLLYGAALAGGAVALPQAGSASAQTPASKPPALRLPVIDRGRVLLHGSAPDGADRLGAREAIAFTDPAAPGRLLMHYDGAGPAGWLACLAESTDGGRSWVSSGAVLPLGRRGSFDSASASSPWAVQDETGLWHLFYLGARKATAAPRHIPVPPYTVLHVTSASPRGPWTKRGPAVLPAKGTWYGQSVSPGPVTRYGGYWLMHVSGFSSTGPTVGVARAESLDGPWYVDSTPLLSASERLENAALHHDPATGLWWLFANHIGTKRGSDGLLYTDGIWGYVSDSPTSFSAAHRVLVLDEAAAPWTRVIGMPSVVPALGGLAVFYDGIAGGVRTDHMGRDIGMAFLPLPLRLPVTALG
ncbi:MAG: twin-arginine translocation signal domain-containing protein [Mycobacteriales bacterium]